MKVILTIRPGSRPGTVVMGTDMKHESKELDALGERVVHRDAEFRDLDHRDSVCEECATEMCYEPDDKEAGVWLGKCDFCGKEKPLTSLAHDWHKAKEVRDGN